MHFQIQRRFRPFVLTLFTLLACSPRAELVLTADKRRVEISRGERIAGPADGSQWQGSLDEPYISFSSGEITGHQTATQSSLFSQDRITGSGSATTTYTTGHSGNGAEADSHLEFQFTVTALSTFRINASVRGGKISDNLSFRGPLPLGSIVHLNYSGSSSTSGTLYPGKYIIEAHCHTQASDSWRDGGWDFQIYIGPPPELTVSPLQLDFGSLEVGEAKTREFTIANRGPSDSVLYAKISPPTHTAFQLQIDTREFTLRGGQLVIIPVRMRGQHNVAVYNQTLTSSVAIQTSDPNSPSLSVPLSGFVKGPEPVNFTKAGVSCLNYLPGVDRLQAKLMWESSTGSLDDLAGVTIYEELRPLFGFVPNTDAPPCDCVDTPAPYVLKRVPRDWSRGPGVWKADDRVFWKCSLLPTSQTGGGLDQHYNKFLTKPYVEASYGLEQRYYWLAPWQTTPRILFTDTILREITAIGPFWYTFIGSQHAGEISAPIGLNMFRNIEPGAGPTGKAVKLRFATEPGNTYELQRAPSPSGPWTTILTHTAEDPGDTGSDFEDSDPPSDAAFYRLLQY